jgi:hypothetical protein
VAYCQQTRGKYPRTQSRCIVILRKLWHLCGKVPRVTLTTDRPLIGMELQTPNGGTVGVRMRYPNIWTVLRRPRKRCVVQLKLITTHTHRRSQTTQCLGIAGHARECLGVVSRRLPATPSERRGPVGRKKTRPRGPRREWVQRATKGALGIQGRIRSRLRQRGLGISTRTMSEQITC